MQPMLVQEKQVFYLSSMFCTLLMLMQPGVKEAS